MTFGRWERWVVDRLTPRSLLDVPSGPAPCDVEARLKMNEARIHLLELRMQRLEDQDKREQRQHRNPRSS